MFECSIAQLKALSLVAASFRNELSRIQVVAAACHPIASHAVEPYESASPGVIYAAEDRLSAKPALPLRSCVETAVICSGSQPVCTKPLIECTYIEFLALITKDYSYFPTLTI